MNILRPSCYSTKFLRIITSASRIWGILLMVCSLGNAEMAAVARLQAIGSASQTETEEVCHQKLAAKCTKDYREADEENLLDVEDMHIFGLSPLMDPLDLVCCNTCKKPIKASQYTVHAELCDSLKSGIISKPDVAEINKKPPAKERKKLSHAYRAEPLREPKQVKSGDGDNLSASEYSVKRNTQINLHSEAKRIANMNGTHLMKGSEISSYNMECSENATVHPSKPFKIKRLVTESLTNDEGNVSACMTATRILYVPKPLATKIYYSQRNHDLRRAINYMFYQESSRSAGHDASYSEPLRVNALPMQTSSARDMYDNQTMKQQGDETVLHGEQKPDQTPAASGGLFLANSGGFIPSMNITSEIPVNNNLVLHCMSNPYSFADRPKQESR